STRFTSSSVISVETSCGSGSLSFSPLPEVAQPASSNAPAATTPTAAIRFRGFMGVTSPSSREGEGARVEAAPGEVPPLRGEVPVRFDLVQPIPDGAADDRVPTEHGQLEARSSERLLVERLLQEVQHRGADAGERTADHHDLGIEQGTDGHQAVGEPARSEEHTSELQ